MSTEAVFHAIVVFFLISSAYGQMFYWHPLGNEMFPKAYNEKINDVGLVQPAVFKLWKMDKLRDAKARLNNDGTVKRVVFRSSGNMQPMYKTIGTQRWQQRARTEDVNNWITMGCDSL
uniref:Uncharacterized protein n=1 Tax=Steinernema glaseri TaxID=37863 RepID=A0A1I8A4J9_9BILA